MINLFEFNNYKIDTKKLDHLLHGAAVRKLEYNLSEKFVSCWKLSIMKLFTMPAGKQIKIPKTNTIVTVCLGSLNLSEK